MRRPPSYYFVPPPGDLNYCHHSSTAQNRENLAPMHKNGEDLAPMQRAACIRIHVQPLSNSYTLLWPFAAWNESGILVESRQRDHGKGGRSNYKDAALD